MMHQVIVPAVAVSSAINTAVHGDIYQIIPFNRPGEDDLFLILWEDHPSSSSIACGNIDKPTSEES